MKIDCETLRAKITKAVSDTQRVGKATALALFLACVSACAQGSTNYLGLVTNDTLVQERFLITQRIVRTNLVKSYPGTNASARTMEPIWRFQTNITYFTNLTFHQFLPRTFANLIWTNFIAHTNGKTTQIWSERRHPADWPKSAPIVKWNHNSILFAMRGFTALSPCWEGEGSSGQVPITALTRRHGYTRGHGMGPNGYSQRLAGKKIWFVSQKDRVVQVRIAREVVRTHTPDGRDYTIVLFDRDLPAGITPIRVAAQSEIQRIYPQITGAPRPLFLTEQGGHVSAGIAGFSVPTWKGGDSGSPNMLPLGDELIFWGGRSTSPPSPEMQGDMDELCRMQKLNPKKYQLQWLGTEAW